METNINTTPFKLKNMLLFVEHEKFPRKRERVEQIFLQTSGPCSGWHFGQM